MNWIPEILQLSIIVERARPPAAERQPSQESNFLPCGIAAERDILQERSQSRLVLDGVLEQPLNELKFHPVPRDKPVVQLDFHAEVR